MEINAVTIEAIDVTHDELVMNGVSVHPSPRRPGNWLIDLLRDLLAHGGRLPATKGAA